jgi:pimeloyl-ACP methyl ester carboxylesterase
VTVTRVNPRTVHEELTRNALSADAPSGFSEIILNRADLAGLFDKDPEAALRILHEEVVSGKAGQNQLFALAELSFLHAQKTKRRDYFLAAAIYAYTFLFPPAGTEPPSPFDQRFRIACDLYNRGLTEGLASSDGSEVELEAGLRPLPFGALEVAFDPAALNWYNRRLGHFIPTAELEVAGVRNRYRRPGLGAPLAASALSDSVEKGLQVAKTLQVPVTAFLRIEKPRQQLSGGYGFLRGRLELYVSLDTESVKVETQAVPLETESTAAFAYMLSRASSVYDLEQAGFLSGGALHERGMATQLVALQPYRSGRIPVVFVHGTASSPARWIEMFNELWNDPRIRQSFQFWFFGYETGNPILYSAMRLRESLQAVRATADPGGRDAALRQMVLIGHSQGGLLVKLMVVDLEKKLREEWFGDLLKNPRVPEETRDLLRRAAAVRPLPFVHRVIFLATPHGGSYVAGNWLAHQLARLVRLPGQILQTFEDIVTVDPELAERFEGRMSSVYGMTPGSPLVTELRPAPLGPGVHGHSIIAVNGDGPPEGQADGVVAYNSAHIEGVDSELVVRSGHSVQQEPMAIEEVRRILLLHAETACQKGVACLTGTDQ